MVLENGKLRCIWSLEYGMTEYEGIPLTNQWLLNCGFIESMKDHFYKDNVKVKVVAGLTHRYYIARDDMMVLGPPIMYVHELQNYFHYLSGGKELDTGSKPIIPYDKVKP